MPGSGATPRKPRPNRSTLSTMSKASPHRVLLSVELNGYPSDDATIPVDGYMFYVFFHKPWEIFGVIWDVIDFYTHDFSMKKTIDIKLFNKAPYWVNDVR